MHDLTEVSHSSSLAASNSLSTNNLLSPLFTALGWKDLKPAIVAAEQADQVLAIELQQAYDAYSKAPNDASQHRLQMVLDQVIGELQADLVHVKKLEKEAAKRLSKPQTNSSGYLASWGNWLKQGAQAFFGSDDASLVERYADIAQQRQESIAALSRFRKELATQATSQKMEMSEPEQEPEIIDVISPASRRLLGTGTPIETVAQYCYPSSSCELSDLYDGVSGFVLQGEAAGDVSGYSVSSAGDINGDGLADMLVGARVASPNNRTAAGKTYVVFGSNQTNAWSSGVVDLSSLMNGQRGFVLQGKVVGEQSGFFVSGAGDINGDGLADVLVGGPNASPDGRLSAGNSYVVFGSNQSNAWGSGVLNLTSLMNGQRGFVLQGEAAGDNSGISVSSAGDINGDGFDDMLVGASGADPANRTDAGKSYVIFGSNQTNAWGSGTLNLTSLMNGQRGFVLQGEATNDLSGSSVSSAGDINGDGLTDVLVGAYGANPAGRNGTGRTYVIFGSNQTNAWGSGTLNLTSLMNGQRGFVLQGEAAGDQSGKSVGSAGDINGDGLTDVLVGAPWADPVGRIDAGKTYVVFGSNQTNAWGTGILDLTSLINSQRGFVLQGEAADDHIGRSVSGAGDINGDSLADILVSAFFADPTGRIDAGKTYVVFGSNQTNAWGTGILDLTSLINSQRGFVLQGEAANDLSGYPVSGVGDINGDSLVDMMMGAHQADPVNRTDAGKTYVLFGDSGCQFHANQLTTYQGVPVLLSSQNLNATYTKPVRFNITAITHGQFEYVSNPGQAITLFNQTEVWNGQIRFVPDGSATAPSYTVQIPGASKIVTYLSQNATINFYEFFNANQLAIHQGESLLMSDTFMNGTSSYPYSPSQVNFTISNLQHGQFVLMPLNNSVLQFRQSELLANQVLFIHDNSAVAPSYNVIVSNPVATLSPNSAQVTFYRQPVWLTNQLTLSQGDNLFLGASHINVTEDLPSSSVVFTINNLQHGQFKLTPANTTIEAFTQQQLLTGQVLFAHDKTDNAPSYQLSLNDSYFALPSEPAVINFTPLPPILGNNSLAVKQGRNTTLTSASLSATDPDPTYNLTTLTFTISDVQHGQFMLTSNATAITQFTQAQVTDGQIVFTHDDSTTIASYKVSASNAKRSSTPQAATVSFDQRPVLLNNRLTIEAGSSVVLAITDLRAIDDITVSGDLLFKVSSVQHGYFSQLQYPNTSITEFVQQRVRDAEIQFQHDGSSFPPSYTLTATDGSGLESFPQEAKINFQASSQKNGIDLQQLYASVSSVGGIVLAVAGYMWWRRKVAGHRRGFELANNLRKAANLEYHDFMRFDGDVFKSKIENFLNKVDAVQVDFYKRLSPTERKSFAVCVAEILEQRKLLKPSGYGMGMYGWMLAFSVGWSQQLDFKKFETQLTEIAQQAVTTWRAEENPTARWPYFSPTCNDKAKAFCCAKPSRAGMFARDKMRLSQGQSVSMTELKHQAPPVSPAVSDRNDIVLSVGAPSSSPRFFDRSAATSDERLGLVEKQVLNLNERLDHLEAETRPLLTGSGSSSS